MLTREQLRNPGWKRGLGILLILSLIGVLLSFGFNFVWDKAHAAESVEGERTSQRNVPCDPGDPCPWSDPVANRWMGVRKYKNDRLGHAPARIRYSRHARRVITSELMAAQRRHNSRVAMRTTMAAVSMDPLQVTTQSARMMSLTRAQMWRKYTRSDKCVYMWQAYGGSGQSKKVWTCEKLNPQWRPTLGSGKLTRDEVRAFFCGASVGISFKAVGGLAGGPWTLAGIALAGVGCYWGHMLA